MGNKNSLVIPSIEENFIVNQARIKNDGKFGKDNIIQYVIEYNVPDYILDGESLENIGYMLKKYMFEEYPSFMCSEYLTCSKKNNYSNPLSNWYNVVYGFYEINAPCSGWARPYGFTTDFKIIPSEIIKVISSNTNIVINYIYGVPFWKCVEACSMQGKEKVTIVNEKVSIGEYNYIEIMIEDMNLITCYTTDKKLLSLPYNSLSKLWREIFGTVEYIKGFETDFPIIRMKGKFYVRYEHTFDRRLRTFVFKTWIYGGIVNMDTPNIMFHNEFLSEQLKSIRLSIEQSPFSRI